MISAVRNLLVWSSKKISNWAKLCFEAYKEWVSDRGGNLATGLAFYQTLAIAPLVAYVYFLSLKTFGIQKTKDVIIPTITDFFPPKFIDVIKFLLTREKKFPPSEDSTFIGVTMITFILGTVNYYAQLKDSIEHIWGETRDKFGFWEEVKRKYNNIKITLSVLLVYTFFVLLNGILPHRSVNHAMVFSIDGDIKIDLLKVIVQLFFTTVLYTFYFKSMAPYPVRFKEAIPAGILGGIFQEIGRIIMIIIVGKEGDTDITASLLSFQIWFYYSNIVLIYSAQFSKVYVFNKRNTSLERLKSSYPKT
jgi:uncharacterized BrkB/YihY/UPF0761 family membrane protein